ncbi:DUF7155 family protein [Mycobacterium neglectum]|uniref:DUF7155 family protein n=1 Tax=Mycobacterium neglectum TaxID=242737 RepID=UPI000BFF1281|nr:hypothetical protein [Mycobacterium neglectum]
MTSTKNQVRRLIAAGAFAVAAVAAPFAASALTTSAASQDLAGPACLAWFGNKEDGHCLSYSNGFPVAGGTPSFQFGNGGGVVGPNWSTGPLLPGQTINRPIG